MTTEQRNAEYQQGVKGMNSEIGDLEIPGCIESARP
jgi:hypothetical protein